MNDQPQIEVLTLPEAFESNERFIGYCELHCTTERGLFIGSHVNYLLQLAGDDRRVTATQWYALDEEAVHPLCKQARAILSQREGVTQ